MYDLYASELGVEGLEEEIAPIRVIIKDTLARVLQESGSSFYQKDFDREKAIDIFRSLLHGVIAFSMSNSLRADKERRLEHFSAQELTIFGGKNLQSRLSLVEELNSSPLPTVE